MPNFDVISVRYYIFGVGTVGNYAQKLITKFCKIFNSEFFLSRHIDC